MENRRLVLSLYLLCISLLSGYAQSLIEVGEGYSSTSVNTAVFRNNSLVTHGNTQFIAFYDSEQYLVLGKRALTEKQWEIKRSSYRGNCQDAHNIISLMLDGEGYLHVSFDHHNDRLNYCRSVAPFALDLSERTIMTGVDEEDVTYPEFYLLANGDLLFVYRSGSSGRGNLVMNRYSTHTQQWTRVQDVLIDGEDQRNAYWQLYVDIKGTIHLSWVWRETYKVETNHDMCYARSFDNGATWYKTTGEQYHLPITLKNAEYACYIQQNSELINQTSMGANEAGNPFIASYWREKDSRVPQYRIIWHDGAQWHSQQVTKRETPFTLKGGGTKMIPIARPRLAVDNEKIWYIFRDVERGSKVSVAYTDNVASNTWSIADLTHFPVHAWEPTYDTELWKQKKQLQLFVQNTQQGDGERIVHSAPSTIYVLEVEKD